MARITSGSAPALFLLQRNTFWRVEALTVIHPLFLTPPVIEKRAALGPNAVRAGWIGCNIRLDRIGPDGEVMIINQSREIARTAARKQFRRFLPLSNLRPSDRGWTVLTLSVIRDLSKRAFEIRDLYDREQFFKTCYPNNNNIKAKIRQQLQVLRDLGVIRFDGHGMYTLAG
jgi:type II restriction enzyme